MQPENPSFHAHHSPMGAMASFTCGAHNASGGMGLELPGPYAGEVNVGYIDAENTLHRLPLFQAAKGSESERYVEGASGASARQHIASDIERDYRWATDSISSEGITFNIITPFFSLADPRSASPKALAFACCPVIHAQIVFTNSSNKPIKGFFALGIDHRWTSLGVRTQQALTGAMSQDRIGFATRNTSARSFIDFDIVSAMNRQHTTPNFLLGPTAGLELDIAPGNTETLDIVLGFYQEGKATYNREMHYYYTRHFQSLAQVLEYGLDHRDAYLQEAAKRDQELISAKLNDEQKFLIAHATRSYYGSTQWLWDGTQSVWVVNEGEYLMMNTFDLSVDMLFFEMQFNPWTVRNLLEQYVENYSFHDQVFNPENPETLYPGGLSFTHDMGVMNHWSPLGISAYEVSGLDRQCFSHMTCEQLTNWVLCAGVYMAKTRDDDFFTRYCRIFLECMQSLFNRDNPNPNLRNGIMGFDSSRTKGGGEITTYDSLDHSLGQARNNIYLGGKMWASYVILEHLFTAYALPDAAKQARAAAHLAANTLANGYDQTLGFIPAILEGNNQSAIIPAIEALVYPYVMGLTEAVASTGPYSAYITALKKHFSHIMTEEQCLYPDGGWKLSSSADNSWASKIALCQYVARQVLSIDFGDQQATADTAHARWQREGATLFACSDQFKSGLAHGSLYYPRIVTNILWMNE